MSEDKPALKNITITLPKIYLEAIDKLISLKFVASRSECVRIAIREYMHKDIKHSENIKEFTKKSMTKAERIERDRKIKQMLDQGKKTAEIVEAIGCKPDLVSRVRNGINGSVY